MIKQFSKYFSIGILNTLIHWAAFLICYSILDFSQSISNLIGFFIAVVFSFFMNAKFTFNQSGSVGKLLSYTSFMGLLSYIVGYAADRLSLPALATLIIFSGISLICGFLYSKYIVFKR